MEVAQIFDESRYRLPIQFWLVALLVIVLIVFFILTLVHFDLGLLKTVAFGEESSKYWVGVLLGFLTSSLATVFTNYLGNRTQSNRVDLIRRLASKELIVGVLEELKYYDNRYATDYEVNASLLPSDNPSLFRLKVDYKYKKIMKMPKLVFHFLRVRTEDERKALENRLYASGHLDKELVIPLDETDFDAKTVGDDMYFVKYCNVRIHGENVSIPLTRTKDGDSIMFTGEIPPGKFVPNALVEIRYLVQFVLEKESYMDFNFDLPTNNISCKFDYSAVKGEVVIGSNNIISSYKGPTYFDKGEQTQFNFEYSGWVLPKSSFFFIWWKNDLESP